MFHELKLYLSFTNPQLHKIYIYYSESYIFFSRIIVEEEIKMKSKLYVIGNGFDLAHKIPSTFNPDFKNIALKYESGYQCFWDLYQTENEDIWSDFENLLSEYQNLNK